ncbi:uncharacterized protein HMPREF1541_01728 [Cyphellophora europaea CBS 101466]|uniref:BTB domain-containing protein n=1 Tax=Cyphellophora europaea (strain CBS 101466) TaxID=1220924 RepID=W2S1H0_CYPE1|nr:uncharacterized protein HMPREF1541_01728 [Cyphellophora europaea CBS 101466]ETN42571.1 hypothetical protein HMPREF1541_01728 [Cyphellophora europaea CBS 101466]
MVSEGIDSNPLLVGMSTQEPPVKVSVYPDLNDLTKCSSFYLPPSLLKEKSEYFRGALSGKLMESEVSEVKLVDVHPKAVKMFVEWLYLRKLHIQDADTQPVFVDGDFMRAYQLADRLLCPEACKNEIMNSLQELHLRRGFHPIDLGQAYTNSLPDSLPWRYLIHHVASDLTDVDLYKHFTTYQAWNHLPCGVVRPLFTEFHKLCVGSLKEETAKDPARQTGCRWQVHTNKKESKCRNPCS